MRRNILVMGGAHVDRRGRIAGATVMGASNPGHFISEPGGGAFNAARALARLGHVVRLITPRGGDAAGESVAEAAREAGVEDHPFVFLDRTTPSYTAILEKDGNLVIALADMDLYRLFTPRRLRTRAVRAALDQADLVLVDANLPEDTLKAIVAAAKERARPIAAIAISPAKVVRFAPVLDQIDYLFMNAAEAAAITGEQAAEPEKWPSLLRARGLRGGLVTEGARTAVGYDDSGIALLSPAPLDQIEDVTGAGDATVAGFVFARLAGLSLAEAMRHGAACAAITLRSAGATAAHLTPVLLKSRLALVPEAKILS